MVNIYFTFSPCYLVLTLTISLCLSPILGFNNSYWLYLQSLPFEVAVTYKTVLLHILLNSYAFLYLCIYVFLIDMILSCNILILCFRREMALSWHSYFLFLFSDSIWKWYALMHSIYGIYERTPVEKTSAIIFGI